MRLPVRSVLLVIGATAFLRSPPTLGQLQLPDPIGWQPRFKGVDYAFAALTSPRPLRGHMVRIDLTDPRVRFVVTPDNGPRPEETDSLRTSSFLKKTRCQLAINANPFTPVHPAEGLSQDVSGLLIADGDLVSPAQDALPALLINTRGEARIAEPPFDLTDVQYAVGGFSIVLKEGQITARGTQCHPRTAAGISPDGRYLYLLVIDGRQPGYSEGASTAEVAAWLRSLGAADGINLDGGGTSTLVMNQPHGAAALVNRPIHRGIPGLERPSAAHLGVKAIPSYQQELFRRDNLVAWCIVPFDKKQRGPRERAEMLQRLGFRKVAYDWREKHVPTFEQEIRAYRQYGLEFYAFWGEHDQAFQLFEEHGLHPQIWITVPSPRKATQLEKVAAAVEALTPLLQRTLKLKCKLGLYNHGHWGGQPENMVAVCEALRRRAQTDQVGIVYNFHHAHDQIHNFEAAFTLIEPYLLCLNLNGMNDRAQPKILPIGQGRHEKQMIDIVIDSGYQGPIGILDHRNELDAEVSLRQNLDGLSRVLQSRAAF
jgi:sugar phosphate isomerase/epimerase